MLMSWTKAKRILTRADVFSRDDLLAITIPDLLLLGLFMLSGGKWILVT